MCLLISCLAPLSLSNHMQRWKGGKTGEKEKAYLPLPSLPSQRVSLSLFLSPARADRRRTRREGEIIH